MGPLRKWHICMPSGQASDTADLSGADPSGESFLKCALEFLLRLHTYYVHIHNIHKHYTHA